MHNTKSPFHYT